MEKPFNLEAEIAKLKISIPLSELSKQAVYDVHKQYKLRTITIDVPVPSKSKENKQPNKIKGKAIITEPADMTVPNLHQVTVEDITDMQPSTDQPLPPSSSEENLNITSKNLPKTEIPQAIIHHNADNQKENT